MTSLAKKPLRASAATCARSLAALHDISLWPDLQATGHAARTLAWAKQNERIQAVEDAMDTAKRRGVF